MEKLLERIAEELSELRKEQLELIKKAEVHNHLLKTHEARSIALQEAIGLQKAEFDSRIKPIEHHVTFINNTTKLVVAVAGGVSTIVGLAVGLFKLSQFLL